jgi:hypothetical protein
MKNIFGSADFQFTFSFSLFSGLLRAIALAMTCEGSFDTPSLFYI